jgi:NADH-quinone oxidoreductase subunit I
VSVRTILQEMGYALISGFNGLRIVYRNLRRIKERVQTVQYPLEEMELSPNYRGALVFKPERCIVCELCEKACPVPGTLTEKTIEMFFHIGESKKRELDEFYIDYASCINCYLCVEACPVDALLPGSNFELATIDPLAQYDRSRMIFGMNQLNVQPESVDQGNFETAYRYVPRERPLRAAAVLADDSEWQPERYLAQEAARHEPDLPASQ